MKTKYFRLFCGKHIVGFKRVSLKDNKKITHYLSMAGDRWTEEKFDFDSEIKLFVPPRSIASLAEVKEGE